MPCALGKWTWSWRYSYPTCEFWLGCFLQAGRTRAALAQALLWGGALLAASVEIVWAGCFPTGFGYQSLPNGIPEGVDRGRGRKNLLDKLHCVGGRRLPMASGRSQVMACYLGAAFSPSNEMRRDPFNFPSEGRAVLEPYYILENPHRAELFWMPCVWQTLQLQRGRTACSAGRAWPLLDVMPRGEIIPQC